MMASALVGYHSLSNFQQNPVINMHASLVYSVVLFGLSLATPVTKKRGILVPDGCLATPGVSLDIFVSKLALITS